jgi:hypothetical protein
MIPALIVIYVLGLAVTVFFTLKVEGKTASAWTFLFWSCVYLFWPVVWIWFHLP